MYSFKINHSWQLRKIFFSFLPFLQTIKTKEQDIALVTSLTILATLFGMYVFPIPFLFSFSLRSLSCIKKTQNKRIYYGPSCILPLPAAQTLTKSIDFIFYFAQYQEGEISSQSLIALFNLLLLTPRSRLFLLTFPVYLLPYEEDAGQRNIYAILEVSPLPVTSYSYN